LFAALSEDGNPAYWDWQWATALFGGPPASSGLTMSMSLPWKPGGGSSSPPSLAVDVPLPEQTFVNVDTDCKFLRPLRWGDHFSVYEEIVDIGPENPSRLGRGHFVTSCMNLLDAQGRLVARLTNVLYRYEVASGMNATAIYPQRLWSKVGVGDVLPPIEPAVEYSRISLNAAATWDYFPGHQNRGYARAQGQPNIYVSTIFFHGFIESLITDWGGPSTFIQRRRMRMVANVHPGDSMRAEGHVLRHYRDESGRGLVDLDIHIDTARGLCVPASATVRLPLEPGERLFLPEQYLTGIAS